VDRGLYGIDLCEYQNENAKSIAKITTKIILVKHDDFTSDGTKKCQKAQNKYVKTTTQSRVCVWVKTVSTMHLSYQIIKPW
jgi:hypothetical protein